MPKGKGIIFVPGDRIRCLSMVDNAPVPDGTEGTVAFVDSTDTIHVNWDNGRKLGLIPGVDSYERV